MRTVCIGFVLLCLGAGSAEAQTQFEKLVQEAHEDLPEARALDRRASAVEAHAHAVEVWKDPVAGLALSNVPWRELSLSEHPMSGVEMKASQAIPYPGKLGARGDAVRAKGGVFSAESDRLVVALGRRAVAPYFDLAEIDAQLPILRERVALLDELIRLAEARYGAGGAPASDAVLARAAKARLARRIRVLELRRNRELARVNAALSRPADAPVPVELGGAGAPDSTLESLLELAERNRPEFVVLARREAVHREEMRARELETRPDFSVGAAWRFRTGDDLVRSRDFFSIFVGVDLPLWSNDAARRENRGHRAQIDALSDDAEALRRDIRGRLSVLLEQLQLVDAEREALAELDLPAARLVQEYLRAEYPTRDSDFLALLQGEDRILQIELDRAVLAVRQARYHQEIRIETAVAFARPQTGE